MSEDVKLPDELSKSEFDPQTVVDPAVNPFLNKVEKTEDKDVEVNPEKVAEQLGDTKGEETVEDLEQAGSLENKRKWTRMILTQAGVTDKKELDRAVSQLMKLRSSNV